MKRVKRQKQKPQRRKSQKPQSGKPVVRIYVNAIRDNHGNLTSEITKTLSEWIARNYKNIMSHVTIHFNRIKRNNIGAAKRAGIHSTPTLVFNGKKIQGVEGITNFLSSLLSKYTNTSVDNNASIYNYQMKLLGEGDNERDDNGTRGSQIRQKMERFQNRRPKNKGQSVSGRLNGGYDVINKPKNITISQDNVNIGNDQFIHASGDDDNFRIDDDGELNMGEWEETYKQQAMDEWFSQ